MPHFPDPELTPFPMVDTSKKAEGADGRVYFSMDGKWAFKQFKLKAGYAHNENEEQLLTRLHYLRSCFVGLPSEGFLLCCPRASFDGLPNKAGIGYVMQRVPNGFEQLQSICWNVEVFHKTCRQNYGVTWRNYLRIARNLARMMGCLEEKRIVHTDLSMRNIFANVRTGQVALIDLDSCIVEGKQSLPKASPGYVAPEVLMGENKASIAAMRHSFAVIIMHLLLFRNVMEPMCDYPSDDPNKFDLHDCDGYGKYALFSEDPFNARHAPLV